MKIDKAFFVLRLRVSLGIGLTFSRNDQVAQAAGDICCPCLGTDVITFLFGNQTYLGELQLCFVILFCYVEDDLIARPFAAVFCKIEIIFLHQPNHFFAGNDLRQFDPAPVYVFVAEDKLIIELACLSCTGVRLRSGG